MSNYLQSTQKKVLSPKLDVVFQSIFGEVGSEAITKRFLKSILEQEINEIDLSGNVLLRKEKPNSKLGILDVFAKINGIENCNIEIQLVDQKNIIERILFYWGRVYTRELKRGEDYTKLKKTITILIANFEIEGLKDLKYHTKWKIIEENERKIILTDKLEIHILMLPKVAENSESEDELIDWLTFLENPNSERVREKMKENEELKQAVEKVNTISEDEYMQRIADLREKAIWDENSIRNDGREEGLEEGLKEGLEKGIKEGEKKAKLETAKKLLEKGIDLAIVLETTGLSEDELKDNISPNSANF